MSTQSEIYPFEFHDQVQSEGGWCQQKRFDFGREHQLQLPISFALPIHHKYTPTAVHLSIQIIHTNHSQDGHDVLHRRHQFSSTCTLLVCRFLCYSLQLHQRLHECGIICIQHYSMALWANGMTISPCDLIPFSVMLDILLLSLANSPNLICRPKICSCHRTNSDRLLSRWSRCESNESSSDPQDSKDRYSHHHPH